MSIWNASGSEKVESVETLRRAVDFYAFLGTSPIERRKVAGQTNGTALTTGAPAVDTLIAMPFLFGQSCTADRIGFNVTVGVAGNARTGIYNATSRQNPYPSSLVVDDGGVSVAGTGAKEVTISSALIGGQLYWAVYLCGTLAPTINCLALAGCIPLLGVTSALGTTPGVGLTVAQAYGALPSSFPASAAALTAVPVPAIYLRAS